MPPDPSWITGQMIGILADYWLWPAKTMAWRGRAAYNTGAMPRIPSGFIKDSETVLSGLLRAGDVIAVGAASLIAYALRAGNVDLPGTYLSATLLGMLLTANYMHFAK